MMAQVAITNVAKAFGPVKVLHDVSVDIADGQFVVLVGPSGCGKTTLLRMLAGFETPSDGQILLDGRDIARTPPNKRPVNLMFQSYALFPHMSVRANVSYGLEMERLPAAEIRSRVDAILATTELVPFADRKPEQLSGGQKQRVGLARALAARPALLLSDEATSALDPETTRSILALLKDINRRLGLTILLITHEMEVIRSIADRVAVIDAGRIVEEGPVWSVFAGPRSEITRSLLGGIRPQLPDEIASRMAAGIGVETILRIDVAGEAARGPLLSDLATAVPGPFRLVHGGIDHVQQQPVGTLFLAVPGNDADRLPKLIAFLEARQARVEVLGHVAGSV
ncbi:MAG: methionine ABC transporter ATP-binding protein [Mesorhizobium sp.]|nr:MAG: methionine ABC transporter ATP-binding protein [Mesorhizobium sp.]